MTFTSNLPPSKKSISLNVNSGLSCHPAINLQLYSLGQFFEQCWTKFVEFFVEFKVILSKAA